MEEKTDFFSQDLTPEERDLYDRQFRLEGWSQKLIKNARVLIAGVGGLGCEIAKNLAMLGVGYLDLVDLDIIEHSNLNRQILFIDAKMGESKAITAAKKLKEINPNITVIGHHTSLERLEPAIYKAADVVVGGLDSMNARLNLNAQCVRFKKPLVDGGVAGYHGHIYTVFPYENACYECNPLPVGEMDDMAACTVVGIPRKRIHCVFKANMAFKEEYDDLDPDPKNVDHVKYLQSYANDLATRHGFLPLFSKAEIINIIDFHDPGIITINAIIASIQSHETVKILHWLNGNKALGEPIKTYVVFNSMTLKLYPIEKKRNPSCLQCGDHVRRITIEINKEDKCEEIINSLSRMGFERNPDLEPTLTIMDFEDIKIIEPNLTPGENDLRNNELILVVGFEDGEIFVNLKLV
ncbi:MAG: ThiF family adenylyltransferase [Promethearchaeota archaeon]|nr:MAG: ThiF family adenylyltransferase [Candidatus Lokiarchaeota archaeon]